MGNSVLTMGINFNSFKDSDETRTMHTNSHNIDIMMGNEKDEIIEKLSESYLQNIFTKYKKDLEEAMRGSKFVSIVLPTSKNRLEMRRIKYRFS